MNKTEFKILIKEACREVIHEELRDILLEAIKSNKSPINESITYTTDSLGGNKNIKQKPNLNLDSLFKNMKGDVRAPMTTEDIPTYQPRPVDPINGTLPPGELSLSQISHLLK